MDKRGDYKYSIIISMILGLLILGLSLYFIFNEYFTSDDLDMQICRESIQLRALMPEAKTGIYVGELKWYSFKKDFPLKCKTMIKTIEKSDVEDISKANKIIAESMAECWALYDKGDTNAFPSNVYSSKSVCVPCARIHLSEDAKKYMIDNNVKIDIRKAMDERMDKDFNYYTYLMNSGKAFPAFNFGNMVLFDLKET